MVRDNTRRDFLKTIGTATSAGALGSLAGCASSNSDGASRETINISYMTGLGAETPGTRKFFKESMKRFEKMKDNVTVDLQFVTSADIRKKLASTVQAGNAPNIAESGSLGINFWKDGEVVDHGKYIEETGIAENWTDANINSAKHRGEWWAGGSIISIIRLLGVRPKLFKEAGIDDPAQFEETWTDFRRALDSIKKTFPDVYAYEESGAWNDLETYWAQAQTAWTDGKDPWFQGEKPWGNVEESLMVGKVGRTDGMIENCVDLANTFSSPKAAIRTNEEIPALMLTDKVASYMTATGNTAPWKSAKKNVTFGWDGDLYTTPIPKLDPNYGAEFDFPGLEGHEGAHGGTNQVMQFQNQIFKVGNEDLAWDLNYYVHTDPNHAVVLLGEVYPSVPTYIPHIEKMKKKYKGDITQQFKAVLNAVDTYTENYHSCGGTWGLETTDTIRWDAINGTISEAIAGQHTQDQVVGVVRERILKAA